jgi:hypothetical protein
LLKTLDRCGRTHPVGIYQVQVKVEKRRVAVAAYCCMFLAHIGHGEEN